MSIFDDVFRSVHEQAALEQEAIRKAAHARRDATMARDALDNMRDIDGGSASFWADMRSRALDNDDATLADLARQKMNEASSGPFRF